MGNFYIYFNEIYYVDSEGQSWLIESEELPAGCFYYEQDLPPDSCYLRPTMNHKEKALNIERQHTSSLS
jgi:hypothetical protein